MVAFNDFTQDNLGFVYVSLVKTENSLEGHPIFTGYKVEGWMNKGSKPTLDRHFFLLRTKKNGEEKLGLFETSKVTNVEFPAKNLIIFRTQNSQYSLTMHPEVEYDLEMITRTWVKQIMTNSNYP